MSDHVLDDEACWCGVPLECYYDLYDALRAWYRPPDPIPPPLAGGRNRARGRQAVCMRACSSGTSHLDMHKMAVLWQVETDRLVQREI